MGAKFLKLLNSDTQVKSVAVSEGVKLLTAEGDDGHGHGEEHEDEHADEHTPDQATSEDVADHHIDPHTWVSPKLVMIMAENIKNSLVEADPDHKAGYEQRYESFGTSLRRWISVLQMNWLTYQTTRLLSRTKRLATLHVIMD